MVFADILKDLVSNVPGALGAMVMGYDGIPLEHFQRPDAANGSSESKLDLQSIGVEYSTVINEIKKNSLNLGADEIHEVTVRSENRTVMIRLVNQEYFVLFVLQAEAFFGKGRYLLRHAVEQVRNQL